MRSVSATSVPLAACLRSRSLSMVEECHEAGALRAAPDVAPSAGALSASMAMASGSTPVTRVHGGFPRRPPLPNLSFYPEAAPTVSDRGRRGVTAIAEPWRPTRPLTRRCSDVPNANAAPASGAIRHIPITIAGRRRRDTPARWAIEREGSTSVSPNRSRYERPPITERTADPCHGEHELNDRHSRPVRSATDSAVRRWWRRRIPRNQTTNATTPAAKGAITYPEQGLRHGGISTTVATRTRGNNMAQAAIVPASG